MWKCTRCEKENSDSVENCSECGHARSMDYIQHRVLSRVPASVTDHWKVDKNSPEYLAKQGKEYLQKAVELFEKANVNKADEPTRGLIIRLNNCLGGVNINGAGERKETQTESSKPVLMADEDTRKVFGQNISRESIRGIEFVKIKKVQVPSEAWDISTEKNRRINAWTENVEGKIILKIGSKSGVYANPDCCSLFEGYSNVEKIEFNDLLNTSYVSDMRNMFSGCRNLRGLDVSGFNTSNVTDMSQMFRECANLKELDISNFDTSRVTNMQSMFCKCRNLKKINISGFNTTFVTNMRQMFCGCRTLEEIDVSHFDTSNVTDMSQMFCGCRTLKEVDVRNFNTDKVTDVQRMFASCRNLVRPNAADFKFHEGTLVQGMFVDSGLTRLFGDGADGPAQRMKKTLKVLNSDTPQFRQYNKSYQGNSIEEICKNFLSDKENSDINTDDNGKLRKTLKIAEEEPVYLLHDDSWFGRGKNGFAITEKGIYSCELLEHAKFVPWEEFQDCTEIEGIKVKLKGTWSVITYTSIGAIRIETLLISIHKFLNQ